jgi:hypothetical protein
VNVITDAPRSYHEWRAKLPVGATVPAEAPLDPGERHLTVDDTWQSGDRYLLGYDHYGHAAWHYVVDDIGNRVLPWCLCYQPRGSAFRGQTDDEPTEVSPRTGRKFNFT